MMSKSILLVTVFTQRQKSISKEKNLYPKSICTPPPKKKKELEQAIRSKNIGVKTCMVPGSECYFRIMCRHRDGVTYTSAILSAYTQYLSQKLIRTLC